MASCQGCSQLRVPWWILGTLCASMQKTSRMSVVVKGGLVLTSSQFLWWRKTPLAPRSLLALSSSACCSQGLWHDGHRSARLHSAQHGPKPACRCCRSGKTRLAWGFRKRAWVLPSWCIHRQHRWLIVFVKSSRLKQGGPAKSLGRFLWFLLDFSSLGVLHRPPLATATTRDRNHGLSWRGPRIGIWSLWHRRTWPRCLHQGFCRSACKYLTQARCRCFACWNQIRPCWRVWIAFFSPSAKFPDHCPQH